MSAPKLYEKISALIFAAAGVRNAQTYDCDPSSESPVITGKGDCGKAETQSFAIDAYADWRFFDNFGCYFGATYAFGMNEAERANILDKSKAEWNSNLAGVFTGVRYAWTPFVDGEFCFKPTIGAGLGYNITDQWRVCAAPPKFRARFTAI